MSAEIIQFGAPRRREIVPILSADTAERGHRVHRQPADLLEEREARNAAWHKVDAERRFFLARVKFLDAIFFAHRAKVIILMDVAESQSFPVEEAPYLEEHHRLVEILRQITEDQLRLPAACSQHVNWKRPFAIGGGWPRVAIERSLIGEYIEADEAFLAACPRKPRGYKGRDG